MTIRLFYKLYQHYKDDFDFEMILRKTGTTYAKAYSKTEEKEWF